MSGDERSIETLADEYVLGLLDTAEAAQVEAEIERDAALRQAVARSRDRFLALDLAAPAASASPDLWRRIESRLDDATPQEGGVADGAGPANDNAARPARTGWRNAAVAGLAASLLLAVGLAWSLLSRPDPQLIAVLMDAGGEPLALVEDFGLETAKLRPLTDFEIPEDRALQVWTLPSEELGPVSLGVFRESAPQLLEKPPLPAPQESQLYEITLEQRGGSPTGRPTGPIIAKGYAKAPR